MRFNLAAAAAAAACIFACIAATNAQFPAFMQLVQLEDLSAARKDMAVAFTNMSGTDFNVLEEHVMFAGGDYSFSGCSVASAVDLYISVNKGRPMRAAQQPPNISLARANLAGTGLTWPISGTTGRRTPGYFAFAGGLSCLPGPYKPVNNIDIYWYNKGQWALSSSFTLSVPRNWMSATTFCTTAYTGGLGKKPICRFMFAGGQTTGNGYSNVVDVLDASACATSGSSLDPAVCMTMNPAGQALTMVTARGSLAVASFMGAAMFAGGKIETRPPGIAQPIPFQTTDYYMSASALAPPLDLLTFNLSSARFDLAGLGFDIANSGGQQQALFAGGTNADLTSSAAVDAYLFSGAQQQQFSFQMSQPRSRPVLGQLGNRYAVVAGGSACPEWQPNTANTGFEQYCCGSPAIDVFDLQGAWPTPLQPSTWTGQLPQQPADTCTFTQGGCGVCDLSGASMDGWFMMAGGQWSINATDPAKNEQPLASVYALQYSPTPDPVNPTPGGVTPDSSSPAGMNPAATALVIIFFLTWGGNMFGVYYYCSQNGQRFLPPPIASPFVVAFFLHGFVWIWLIKYYAKGKTSGSAAFHATLL